MQSNKNKIRTMLTAMLAAFVIAALSHKQSSAEAALPVIVPTGTEVPAGSRGGFMQIAFVRGKRVQVTVNGGVSATVNGVTLSSLAVNEAGAVRAFIAADCRARDAHFTLRAADNRVGPAVATLRIAVLPNSGPTLSYDTTQVVAPNGSATIHPIAGPSDQGGIARMLVRRVFPRFSGSLNVNEQGVITIDRAPTRGSYSVTIRAIDSCGAFRDASFTLKVGTDGGGGGSNQCPIIGVNPLSLPHGYFDVHYHQQLTAGGGAKPIEFTVAGGKLPQGLKLSLTGLLMGKPRKAGQYQFGIRATDARGCWGSGAYTLTIRGRRDDLVQSEPEKTAPEKTEPESRPVEPEKAAPEKTAKKSRKAKSNEAASDGGKEKDVQQEEPTTENVKPKKEKKNGSKKSAAEAKAAVEKSS